MNFTCCKTMLSSNRIFQLPICLKVNYLSNMTTVLHGEQLLKQTTLLSHKGYTVDSSSSNGGSSSLYEGHIPTSFMQKVLLSFGSAVMSLADPYRGDMIATLGETTGYLALRYMRQKMLSDSVGQQILLDRPVINTRTVDLNYLRQLPDNTFGKLYVTWLDTNEVSPDSRAPVQFVDDHDLAYVMLRYRQVHDLLHSLLGMPTSMLGEVVVKWFEAIQTGLPMCASAALLGPLRLRPKQMEHLMSTHLWWAMRNARTAQFFMNVYYERQWETDIDTLRQQLNIEQPPHTPALRRKPTLG